MSKESFLRFREAVMRDAALQSELVNTVKSQADLLAMGKRLGFEFDAADLNARELTEDELAKVAGGAMLGNQSWSPVATHEKWIDIGAFHKFADLFPK